MHLSQSTLHPLRGHSQTHLFTVNSRNSHYRFTSVHKDFTTPKTISRISRGDISLPAIQKLHSPIDTSTNKQSNTHKHALLLDELLSNKQWSPLSQQFAIERKREQRREQLELRQSLLHDWLYTRQAEVEKRRDDLERGRAIRRMRIEQRLEEQLDRAAVRLL